MLAKLKILGMGVVAVELLSMWKEDMGLMNTKLIGM